MTVRPPASCQCSATSTSKSSSFTMFSLTSSSPLRWISSSPLFLHAAEAKRRPRTLTPRRAVCLSFGEASTYPAMEEYLVTAVDYLRLVVEAIGAAVVGFGAVVTAVRFLLTLLGVRDDTNTEIRLFLGRYLALGLGFQFGGDILSPPVRSEEDTSETQ